MSEPLAHQVTIERVDTDARGLRIVGHTVVLTFCDANGRVLCKYHGAEFMLATMMDVALGKTFSEPQTLVNVEGLGLITGNKR